MPSDSVFGAAIEKFKALPWAGTPPALHLSRHPLRGADGQPIPMPYCVLVDQGMTPEYDFAGNLLEKTAFRFHAHAGSLDAAEAIGEMIRFAGQAPGQRAGFDLANALPLATKYALKACGLTDMVRYEGDQRGPGGALVFTVELGYSVLTQRVG